MAQDQLLVSSSGVLSAACIPASAENNDVDVDVSSNSTPDSGMHDDDSSIAVSVDSNDTGISSVAASDVTASVTAVQAGDRHSGHSPQSDQEHQPLQQQQQHRTDAPLQQQPQHVVHVHVNPGETFRVRMGNQVQQIKGPATVRMVSCSGPPPLPIPRLQQPPGHVIQQLIDENGVLTHVILSPQPPSIGQAGGTVPYLYNNWEPDMQSLPQMQQFPWNGNGQGMQPFYPPPHFPNATGQYTPTFHHHPMAGAPAHVPPPPARMMPAGGSSRSGAAIQQPQHVTPAAVPQPYSDDRGVRKRRQGLDRQQRRGGGSSGGSVVGGGGGGGGGGGVVGAGSNGRGGGNSHASSTPPRLRNATSGSGAASAPAVIAVDPMGASSTPGVIVINEHQHPVQILVPQNLLLCRPTVNVVNIEARKATIHITPPDPPVSHAQDEARQLAVPDANAAASSSVTTDAPADALEPISGSCGAAAAASPEVLASPAIASNITSDTLSTCHAAAASSPDTQGGQQEAISGVPDDTVVTPDYVYNVQISEQKKDGTYKVFYHGDATEIVVEDLKPATDYFVKVGASLASLRWPETEPFLFRTISCVPEPPSAPTMVSRARSNISLRWQLPHDNGSKVTAYSLEMDQGDGKFVEVYNGVQRSFKVTKLYPSTGYLFRVAAINAVGKSDYSEFVQYFTSGSLPETPDRPQLMRATAESLSLFWSSPSAAHASGGDDGVTYSLQMEEEWTQHGFRAVYNGAEPKYTVDRLRRNSDYKFRVCASNEEGPSKWSPVAVYRTLPDSPGAPGRPQTKGKVNPMSFRLTWEPPRDTGGSAIESYVVELDYGADFEKVYCGSANECTCTELHPGFAYRARVACRSAAGLMGPWSEPTAITTPPVVPAACPAPRLHGRARPQSIDIRWSAPDYDGGAKVTEYRVQLTEAKSSSTTGDIVGGDRDHALTSSCPKEVYRAAAQPGNMSCTIASLVAGRSYLVQVRAVNKAGEGPWSEALCVMTGAAPPSQPEAPQCVVRASHSAVVSWSEPASNGSSITEYRLYCAACDSGAVSKVADGSQPASVTQPAFNQVYAGPAVTHEVKGLMPSTSYLFKVEAVNSAGVSESSMVANCRTAASAPGPVIDVTVIDVQATQVQLQWRAPASHGSQIVGYEVYCDEKALSVSGDVTTCTVDDLQPQTMYKVRVRAINGVGCGPFSAPPMKVTTSPLPPPAPELESTAVTSNSIKLHWTAVTTGQLPYFSKPVKQQNSSTAVAAAASEDGVTYTLIMLREGRSAIMLYNGPALMYKVNKLAENTAYKFQVYAANAAGNGQLSDVVTVVTAKAQPPAVKAPCATRVMPTSVQLAWPACQLRATSEDSIFYVVQLLQLVPCEAGAAPVYEERYRGTELSCTLTDLEPSTKYQARVAPQRVCSNDDSVVAGAFSPAVEFQTGSFSVSSTKGSESAEGDAATRGTAVVEKLRQTAQLLRCKELEPVLWVGLFIAISIISAMCMNYFFGL